MPSTPHNEDLSNLLERVGGTVSSEQDGLEKIALLDVRIAETPEGSDWATLQAAKANVLNQTPGAGIARYIELAIECYQAALRYRTREETPELWMRTLSNLGAAWRRRLLGERANNLEEALACYRQIDKVLPKGERNRLWASAQANLGNVWFDRIVGDKKDNIEKAIIHLQQALTVFTEKDCPLLWARCTSNLALVYQERIAGERDRNLEKAIALNRSALKVYETRPKDTEWARIQNNLGANYRNRISGDSSVNLEDAIHHYQNALQVWSRERFADDWARIQLNLGIVYRHRIAGDRTENLRWAKKHLQACLEIRSPQRFPTDWIRTQHSLALTGVETNDWPSVIQIAELVMRHLDTLMQPSRSLYERRRLVGLISAVKNLGVLGCAHHHSVAEAYRFLRQGRGLIARSMVRDRSVVQTQMDDQPLRADEAFLAFLVLPLDEAPLPVFLAYLERGEERIEMVRLHGLDRKRLESLFEAKTGNESNWLANYSQLHQVGGAERFKKTMDRVLPQLSEAFGPVWDHLQQLPGGIDRLRIAGSGLFTLFPFAAFRDASKQSCLLQHFEITHAAAGLEERPVGSVPQTWRLLSIVDPKDDLPHSREEGRLLAPLFADHDTLAGDQATKPAVLKAIRQGERYSHLHFACHGRFQWRHPEKSGLVLSDEELLTFDEILQHGKFAKESVVVLSACETGVTEYRELPDETYGLPLAFLLAGAGTVINTLWPVPDQSTKWIMLRFYQALHEGLSPSQALRTAQLWLSAVSWVELREYEQSLDDRLRSVRGLRWSATEGEDDKRLENDKPFSHPFYWAGFTLIAS